ncbi:hypothetical protein WJX73_009202 [Symbiochloris irregularis]|uniref:Protein kinase domain-containing protein n=1 Tax=Symbiochloris irregularis TaxID=706552 RepID=A0AAW1PPX5_9CHLO
MPCASRFLSFNRAAARSRRDGCVPPVALRSANTGSLGNATDRDAGADSPSGSQSPSPLAVEPATQNGDGQDLSKYEQVRSLHGDTAAQRRAITELLFFCSVGDVRRCERLCKLWHLKLSDEFVQDYDKRTPLHLAASENSYAVAEWLVEHGARINAVDRFKRTPLEEAVNGTYKELTKFLLDKGGKVCREGRLCDLSESNLSGAINTLPNKGEDLDLDWEVDPARLQMMEKLGEGEFGVVHKAMWNGTLVAVKSLKQSSEIALADFRSEIETLRKVHHPNAVQFLGARSKAEPYLLITELMSGGSVADAFRRERAFGLRRSIEIALDAARGLAYMQAKKPSPIVHRDLKPANLMVAGSPYYTRDKLIYDIGTIKLADFGLSKSLPINKHVAFDLDDTYKLTGETGSYRYMAPEVFNHEPYNSLVDVYSFSMIMYQLFEQCAPFAGMDPVEAARLASKGKRPHLSKLASSDAVMKVLRELIERCWHQEPTKRPSFEEIVGILDGQGIVSTASRLAGPNLDDVWLFPSLQSAQEA